MVLAGIFMRLHAQGTSVNKHTIQRSLNKNGLYCHRPGRTPIHKPCHASFKFTEARLDRKRLLGKSANVQALHYTKHIVSLTLICRN